MRLMRSEAISPAINAMASPLKDWIGEDDARADDDGERGQQHRPEADGAGIDDGFGERHAFSETLLDEIDEDDRIAHHDSGAGHEADHRGGRKKGAEQAVRGQDADEREWNRDHHDERREEAAEPADHQHVDQHEHGGEGGAEVAEDFDRDVPFAIPFQRRLRVR